MALHIVIALVLLYILFKYSKHLRKQIANHYQEAVPEEFALEMLQKRLVYRF